MSNILKFKVSSGIKDIVGKDLITDDFIAVFELVKNSYDARAKDVVITFLEDKIIIADNGKGMTLNEIKTKWLFLAYSAKKDNTEDKMDFNIEGITYRDKIQSKIHYAGSKGIGRFSADRLGKKLKLITKSIDSNRIEQIKIDWGNFSDQNKEFETVNIDHDTLEDDSVSFPKNVNHGLILEIENVIYWSREKIIDLKHSLEKLINPFSETNDFNIDIVCPREIFEDENGVYRYQPHKGKKYGDRDKANGKVKNAILDVLELKTTQIIVEINLQQIETRIYDRGTLIYHIKETNKNFHLLKDVKIDLFFLNAAAKNNFTRKMGIEPINFGSVFLFKNGFRVQPFGNPGDDSWGLDFRAQQGYNRFLGTRDLFGRIEVITENTEEFKEVSSRDGGLVKTFGYEQLLIAFKEKALVRLERYVVGVLWGEAFKKKNYFGTGDDATKKADYYRRELQENDKNSESIAYAASNLGSKIDFIQLIKNLSLNKDIEIINFNREFVDIINEKLDEINLKYINDLEAIAEKTNDPNLKILVLEADKRYKQLIAEKEEAEQKAKEEERKRIDAEAKAKAEENARKVAEQKQKEEEQRRIKAELETSKKENERKDAEIAKLKAEKKAKEEEEKRKKEEEARKIAEKSLDEVKDQNTYLRATRKTLSEDAEELIHTIKISVIGIDESLESILSSSNSILLNKTLHEELSNIKLIVERVKKLSKLITKSNFKADEEVQKVDIVKYIKEYIDTYSYGYKDKVSIKYNGDVDFVSRISLLDLSIIIDNLVSNSIKAGAKKILIEFKTLSERLNVFFHDDGVGLDLDNFPNTSSIFSLGVKSSNEGSGIGLFSVKKKMIEMHGDISFVGNNQYFKGATFKLEFR